MTGPPVFDPEPLNRIADTVDLEFAREVAELYLLQLDDLAAAMETGLRDGDDEAGQRAAHNLKASSGQVGAAALAALCRRIELGEAGDAEEAISELNHLVKATRNVLESEWDRPSHA